jgi:hypothetical protein
VHVLVVLVALMIGAQEINTTAFLSP